MLWCYLTNGLLKGKIKMKLFVVSYPFEVMAESESDAIKKVDTAIKELSKYYVDKMKDTLPELNMINSQKQKGGLLN